MRINTWPIPHGVERLENTAAVVIDVLRASTTIVSALANGAERVIPVQEVDEAFALAGEVEHALLAGERDAIRVEGFDLGNSPFEYEKSIVEGKTIVMTTTNGTQASAAGKTAGKLIVAGFVNAHAVVSYLKQWDMPVSILCAGTRGRYTIEDAMCAGLLIERLESDDLCDFSLACRELYRVHKEDFASFLMHGTHAQNLVRKGFSRDVERAFSLDVSNVVPQRDAYGALVSMHV